ncbi:MAG TPA: phosphoenolpyruvate carboxykinase (ATP) [Saprospiraceae bacterium]|nr:phosphoenolpyruvate carboxykinase (ATP) [Saprospiraceae bacterium]
MTEQGIKNQSFQLSQIGIHNYINAYWNSTPEELVEQSIQRNMAVLSDKGALVIKTGEFTGRSPKDKFTIKDELTTKEVNWNNFNIPMEESSFEKLYTRVTNYFSDKDIFIRDAYGCADPSYKTNIRIISEYPWSNQFAYNMFLRPELEELASFTHDWLILCAPGCLADPETDGTRQHNFSVINFTKKVVLIGGSGYTGEIKKGIFTVLNFELPVYKKVLPMHCSANIGKNNDTAIFFGLSGTGKTTLSADPNRYLIGDDEHGWSNEGVFNFEGGCYAKCIDLSEEKEPEIFHAIKHRAILENINFKPGTRTPDYYNSEITENTRVSYPIDHINNIAKPSKGGHPANIFFLTCDAFGVLPPISKLTPGQTMYHFISGYTAKVAGTEEGVKEPTKTFSACFGAPFLPLHPTRYAEMLGNKMREHKANVWLINTGWSGGEYGTGERMSLKYTRAMITAVLEGKMTDATYITHDVFGLNMPTSCPNVPEDILNPINTWANKEDYYKKANILAQSFVDNFDCFKDQANEEILAAAPNVASMA